jgi:hypothetical protein
VPVFDNLPDTSSVVLGLCDPSSFMHVHPAFCCRHHADQGTKNYSIDFCIWKDGELFASEKYIYLWLYIACYFQIYATQICYITNGFKECCLKWNSMT